MLIRYTAKKLSHESQNIIDVANSIIEEYQVAGFKLTLRQLYYQFVARDMLPNTDKSYDRLGRIISDGRMGGLIDWDAIEDRTRFLRSNTHWDSPRSIVHACAHQYRVDRWKYQGYRPEVWIEKDALVGVIEGVCRELDVPFFSCRGYVSQSELWASSQRLLGYLNEDPRKMPIIFHLGDHDPSGVDMSRDIEDRLKTFLSPSGFDWDDWAVNRIALTMGQVEEYNPPPNAAKFTDARARNYVARFGESSWELDALDPTTLANLIRSSISPLRNMRSWNQAVREETAGRSNLSKVASHWTSRVIPLLRGLDEDSDEEE